MVHEQTILIQQINPTDRVWVEDLCIQRWGSNRIVTRGALHIVTELPGFVAWESGQRLGLLTYHMFSEEFEIVTLDSLESNLGVGSALISEAVRCAQSYNFRRIWLITTNDNTPALRFYQKRGFSIAAIHRDAVKYSRKIKPEIPLTGIDGIPIKDEIEFECLFN